VDGGLLVAPISARRCRAAQRGHNALNQIYDLEIDRCTEQRQLTSGRLTIAQALALHHVLRAGV